MTRNILIRSHKRCHLEAERTLFNRPLDYDNKEEQETQLSLTGGARPSGRIQRPTDRCVYCVHYMLHETMKPFIVPEMSLNVDQDHWRWHISLRSV